jgi:hypothetical protein
VLPPGRGNVTFSQHFVNKVQKKFRKKQNNGHHTRQFPLISNLLALRRRIFQ